MTTTQHATIGHVAMYYLPGDEVQTRRLFELLGCTLVDNGPDPGNDGFTSVVVSGPDWNHVDDILYLAPASAQQQALEAAIGEALRAGSDDEHPALRDFRAVREEWPEIYTHFGIRFRSLDDVERAVAAIEIAGAPGGELEGRASVSRFRARAGRGEAIDQRMEESTVFDADDRPAFGDYAVQCFVKTDLVAAGIPALGQTIELDYYFDPAFDAPADYSKR